MAHRLNTEFAATFQQAAAGINNLQQQPIIEALLEKLLTHALSSKDVTPPHSLHPMKHHMLSKRGLELGFGAVNNAGRKLDQALHRKAKKCR